MRLWLLVISVIVGVAALTFMVATLIDERRGPDIVIQQGSTDEPMLVTVEGAVVRPGSYTLQADARVGDLIQAAGGLAPDADVAAINPADRLVDGEQIIIPSRSPATPGMATPSNLININTAPAALLETLPGIGPVLAQRIVDHRSAMGPFRSVGELAIVEGISPSLVEEIRDLVTV